MKLQHSDWRANLVHDFFFTNKFSTNESAQIYNRSCDLSPGFYLQLKTICVLLKPPIFSSKKKIILVWGFCDALSMIIIFTYLCTLSRNIDYPRLCYYPCLLARCPANNAKEENVKLIEISFVSWFSSLLGQVQKAAEIINRSQTHSMVGSQTTDTRW